MNNPNPFLIPEDFGFWRKIKRYLLTGFLVLGPIAITVFLLWKSFLLLDSILGRGINYILRNVLDLKILGTEPIPGIGFIALVILLILTGFAAHNVFGQWLIQRSQRFMNQIPLVNRVYHAVEQISQAIFSGKHEVFKHAVLIEYPRKGIYSIAIMTADTSGHLQDMLPEDSISVFLPTTPNPTSGFLLFVPKKDVIRLNISVEEALKLIISGGALTAMDREVLKNLSSTKDI